jgi:geranylgeranyl diphosphate synthase type II
MNARMRIEQSMAAAVGRCGTAGAPPHLAEAVRYAVFPGGARIRPRLCLAVAAACGEDDPAATDGAAAAIELLHCASLVHDDLPCFDDAATRRGKPSVHRAFGEPLAVLAGDALIVAAFQAVALGASGVPQRLGTLIGVVGRAAGMPFGIAAGQAWECEPDLDLATYQRAKTGALFSAATVAGAASAGADPEPWRAMGEWLGEAYQVADDIRDAVSDPEALGKPVGRDLALGRPSAALQLGVGGAIERLEALAAEAVRSIPPCPGAAELRALIRGETRRLLPEAAPQRAA